MSTIAKHTSIARCSKKLSILLIVVGILAPAASFSSTMLHLPVQQDVPYLEQGLSKDSGNEIGAQDAVVEMGMESCHEMNGGESASQSDKQQGQTLTSLGAAGDASSDCCELSCECSDTGCNTQLGLVSLLVTHRFGSEQFLKAKHSHYRSLHLAPQSPPPTA